MQHHFWLKNASCYLLMLKFNESVSEFRVTVVCTNNVSLLHNETLCSRTCCEGEQLYQNTSTPILLLEKVWWTDLECEALTVKPLSCTLTSPRSSSHHHDQPDSVFAAGGRSDILSRCEWAAPCRRPLWGWFHAIVSDALQPLRWQQEPDSTSCSPLQDTRQIPPLNTRLREIWPPFTSEDLSDELAPSPVKPSAIELQPGWGHAQIHGGKKGTNSPPTVLCWALIRSGFLLCSPPSSCRAEQFYKPPWSLLIKDVKAAEWAWCCCLTAHGVL